MEKDLILTCDAGTTGCKVTLIDAHGEALFSVRRDYPTLYPKPNWAEQDPALMVDAVLDGVKEILQQVSPQRIACVGLDGTMNGCIPVDAEGKLLHPNIIHSDSRTEAQVQQICQVIDPHDFYKLTGNRPDTHYTLPKMLWFKQNLPEVYAKTKWFLNLKDYLYFRLTDRLGYTDYSDASLTAAMDITKWSWSEELLRDLELDITRMPRVLPGFDIRGKTTRAIYYRTGLITGTPVAIGCGDGCATARGAGLSDPGSAYAYIGSSGWVSQILDHPVFDPEERTFNYLDCDGKSYHVIGTVQTSAAAFDWALKNLMGSEEAPLDISRMENMARQIQPGAEGVLFLPTLMGSRSPYWDPNTRGVLMGFTLYHDQRHIARAIYEGVAFALNSCAEVLEQYGEPITSMMLTGGGARSGLWPDILSAVFGLATKVHKSPGECTSLGAAFVAGVGAGIFSSFEDATRTVKARSTHPVNPAWRKAYSEIYPIYRDIYERVKPLNDRIAQLGAVE